MHLTDEQLNEYLDHESAESHLIEAHLASCAGCAERLAALQALFSELEALPEAALRRDLAERFRPRPAPLPSWLRLAALLQAALALAAGAAALPLLRAWLAQFHAPTLLPVLIKLRALWDSWPEALSGLRLPSFEPPPLPVVELSSLLLALAAVSILWILGNGLLLRRRPRQPSGR